MNLSATEINTYFFDKSPSPMLVFNRDTLGILKVNEAAVEKYGYSAEEFLEMSIKDLRPADDNLYTPNKKLKRPHFRHQAKNGDMFHVQITSRNFLWKQIEAQLAVIHDVSGQVETQQQLSRAQHIAGIGSWELDIESMKLNWSDEVYHIFGLSKEQFTPTWKRFLQYVLGEDKQELQQALKDLISGEGDNQIAHRIITSQGDIRHVVERGKVDRDGEGHPLKVNGTIQDITDRKKAEEAVKGERKFSNLLIKNLPDAFWLMDKDGKAVDWNENLEEVSGFSKGEIQNRFILDFFAEEERVGLQEALSEAFEEGIASAEGTLITKEGEEIPHALTGIKFTYHEEPFIAGIGVNIQALKERQKKLEETENELSRAQQIANIGSFGWDVVNDEINFSEEANRIYELDPQKKKKPDLKKIFEIIHPDDREFVNKKVDGMLQGKGFNNFEHRLRMANGKVKYVMERGDVEYADDGSAITVFGTVQDITHQKEVEFELLRRSKAIDSTMDGVAILDANNRFIYMNEANAKMYGYDAPRELVGKSWEKLYSKEKINYFENEVLPEVEKHGKYRDEDTAQRKDGSFFPKEFTFSRVEDGGLICICRDITERKKAEKQIQDSLREKDVLLAEIHHRVKNNLAVISGLLELEAMNREDDSLLKQVMHESQLRIQSMAMIHEKLYQTNNFTDIQLENYIVELVDTISNTMNTDGRNISINIDSDDITLNINYAIPCALIINEMVTNAFKYAFDETDKGKLDIKLKSKDDNISLVVRDNGPGLPKNFEEESKSSLGYVLIKQLTKQLNGKLKVESTDGACLHVKFRKDQKSGSSGSTRLANGTQK